MKVIRLDWSGRGALSSTPRTNYHGNYWMYEHRNCLFSGLAHLWRCGYFAPKVFFVFQQNIGFAMSKDVYELAISSYVTFRGEADSKEEYVDKIFDQFRDWLEEHPDVVNIETNLDYATEVFLRPSLKREQ